MGKDSEIQWTGSTWNPWHGCKKVSAGCKYCYMFRDKERYKQDPTVVLRSKSNFRSPLNWKEPQVIFTCSWSDWFIEEADQWRDEAWKIIKDTPWHTYQILTKRPERIKDHLPTDWGKGYSNVWIGVSVESQDVLEERVRALIEAVPHGTKFVSAEPLLGPLNFEVNYFNERLIRSVPEESRTKLLDLIQWVIVGGESGNDTGKYQYRECGPSWIAGIIDQCERRNVPIFVKQLGTYVSKTWKLKDRHGGDIDEWPEVLQIRQFPIKP